MGAGILCERGQGPFPVKRGGCFSVLFALHVSLAAALTAAPSAPLRKDIPTIAKAANGAVVAIIVCDRDVDGMLASDKARDIAVIKAHGENFHTVTLGDSSQVHVGDEVVAIGNPLSLESTVSNGIISGIRTIEEEGSKFLQITAPISPGSSGGPLFDMAGQVVGITTLDIKGGESLNFAIPINDVKPMLQTRFSKLSNLPNEPKVEDKTDTQKQYVEHPKSDREYYKQLYDSGAFSELLEQDAKASLHHFVCFDDDENSEVLPKIRTGL